MYFEENRYSCWAKQSIVMALWTRVRKAVKVSEQTVITLYPLIWFYSTSIDMNQAISPELCRVTFWNSCSHNYPLKVFEKLSHVNVCTLIWGYESTSGWVLQHLQCNSKLSDCMFSLPQGDCCKDYSIQCKKNWRDSKHDKCPNYHFLFKGESAYPLSLTLVLQPFIMI